LIHSRTSLIKMGVFEWNEAETAQADGALSGACGAGVWSGRVVRVRCWSVERCEVQEVREASGGEVQNLPNLALRSVLTRILRVAC
ncbi:MAG: hypothetical protein J7L30_02505, partial [Methanophagales archaeon]|nr:hypothetical protein [Methanophagales archaeon]